MSQPINRSFSPTQHIPQTAFSPRLGTSPVSDSGHISPYPSSQPIAASPSFHAMFGSQLGDDRRNIQRFIMHHIKYTLNRRKQNVDSFGTYQATSLSVRNRLTDRYDATQQHFEATRPKTICYLSLEYLMGRLLQAALVNLRLTDNFAEALSEWNTHLEDLYEHECDAALGNGGLGRLAACFLDSMATLNLPAWGYGMRYTYGMFHQRIHDGFQVEFPEFWLTYGNPWEVERLDVQYLVRFGGRVACSTVDGEPKFSWEDAEVVRAVAYDTMIPGFNTNNTISLRLWSAKPAKEFDLQVFSSGDFFAAVTDKQSSENITSVLYPNDQTENGQILRLKQEYFFVSATLQDILERHHKMGYTLKDLPEKIAVQLNDTHPALAIPELMRIMLDEESLGWGAAWDLVTRTCAYTNHTILPEALEKWPVHLLERILPRHLQIIYEINHRFLTGPVERRWPGDIERMRALSCIEEGDVRRVRMANLCIVGSHTINGVAAIHSEILKDDLFHTFYELWPHKFQNKTNGVTPRRWLLQANPSLSALITRTLGVGDSWATNLRTLRALSSRADDATFQREWANAKLACKEKLSAVISTMTGISVDPNALFDVHAKRIHQYKRQLLNILGVVHRYTEILRMGPEEKAEVVPRVVIFAGKAAVGYDAAKRIIKLINNVAQVVNEDNAVNNLLKIVFIPNYCVSLAEVIIPASDISQHISTAGMEASGTGNMKFALNGGLILGTLDGANIEIAEEIGTENMFIFGAEADQVAPLRELQKAPGYTVDERLRAAIDLIKEGVFGDFQLFAPILDHLLEGNDFYLISQDFAAYLEAQRRIDETWKYPGTWNRMSINSTARMAKFSSDRTIQEYADEIWGVKPCPVSYRTRDLRDTPF